MRGHWTLLTVILLPLLLLLACESEPTSAPMATSTSVPTPTSEPTPTHHGHPGTHIYTHPDSDTYTYAHSNTDANPGVDGNACT